MLNFVLCDDNLAVLNRLCKMLEAIFINHKIDAHIGLRTQDANEVISYVNSNNVSVLILDINLKSNMSGIELAQKIRDKNNDIYIIFTTAHLEYVMLAYKVKTFDYLAKPITDERLEETILRLIKDITHNPKRYIKIGNKNTFINENDVNFIKKDGMKLVFYTTSGRYEVYSSFNKIESCLPENFVRCHKSYIANVNNITNINSDKKIAFPNFECDIGPKYKHNLMEVLKNGNFSNNLDKFNE